MNKRREFTLPEREAQRRLRILSRRGFLLGGVVAAAGYGGYRWLQDTGQIGEVPWPQRDVLDFNGRLAHGYLSDLRLARTYPPEQIGKLKPNGGEGLDDEDGLKNWSLTFDPGGNVKPLTLGLNDVKSLPQQRMITNLHCIEGWNTIVQWTGVRFADFLAKYNPAGSTLRPYVYMATPDREYYVGLDMKSAIHPQTLLAWELNGKELTPDHGAPLRLVIPVKYGIKNIKRVALIQLTDQRPADYWAENGYDWFAGL